MIGVPLILWLIFGSFALCSIEQLYSLISIFGLIMICFFSNRIRTQKILLIDIVCFIFLIVPLASRLLAVPLNLFNYNAFIIPTLMFLLCYLISLTYSFKQYLSAKNEVLIRNK